MSYRPCPRCGVPTTRVVVVPDNVARTVACDNEGQPLDTPDIPVGRMQPAWLEESIDGTEHRYMVRALKKDDDPDPQLPIWVNHHAYCKPEETTT